MHYRFIDEGRRGIMGLGARDVHIEVELPAETAPPVFALESNDVEAGFAAAPFAAFEAQVTDPGLQALTSPMPNVTVDSL